MKKFLMILMLVIGIIANADWEVVITGEDKNSKKDLAHPYVMALYDYNDGKYDIHRCTASHGYGLSKGDVLDKQSINMKDGSLVFHPVLVYKGKKCINLTKDRVVNILNNIQFKECEMW